MFQALVSYHARQAAIGLIGPRLAESRVRLGAIPVGTWRDPYIIGFLSMLITLIATEARSLQPEQLADVQTSAWSALTATEGVAIGEDILVLSAAGNADFVDGCRCAHRYFAASGGRHMANAEEIARLLETHHDAMADQSGLVVSEPGPPPTDLALDALWKSLFEDHIRVE